jgi:FtsZ-interacting cell division protein ZipA
MLILDKSKFLIQSLDRKLLPGILALVFLLTMILSEVDSSQASEASGQEVLRKAAQGWIQRGMEQYRQHLFEAAERSFRCARVYRKHLTAAEREQLNELLAKVRIAGSEANLVPTATQTVNEPVEQGQPVKAESPVAEVKNTESPTKKVREETGKKLKQTSNQTTAPEEQTVDKAEPDVSKNQVEPAPPQTVVLVTKASFMNKLTRCSSWLRNIRRELLIAALPALALLLLIARRQRRGTTKRVYTNVVREHSPIIGLKLAQHKRSRHGITDLEEGRVAYVPERHGKQKKWKNTIEQWKTRNGQSEQLRSEINRQEQATRHPKQQTAEVRTPDEKPQHELTKPKRTEERPRQQADEVPAAGEPSQRKRKWPHRDYKYEDCHRVIGEVKEKLCRRCEKWHAESNFHKNRSCKDNLASWCKECKAKAAKEYRRKRTAARNRPEDS